MIDLLFIIPIAICLSGVAYESGLVTLLGLIVAAAIVYFMSGLDPIMWCVSHPFAVVLYVVGYFLVGAVWARIKFGLWLMDEQESMVESLERWRKSNANVTGKDLTVGAFKTSLEAEIWKPTRNKSRIMMWMTWWVPSVFWTLTHDFFQKAWKWVYEKMSHIFERASDSAFDRYLK